MKQPNKIGLDDTVTCKHVVLRYNQIFGNKEIIKSKALATKSTPSTKKQT
jgi:hypothetical protein